MSKTKLSININKIALLRNAREQNSPDIIAFTKRCIELGAHGITVHPRPDGRHIRNEDVIQLAKYCQEWGCEFNIEGYPSNEWLTLVKTVTPTQATLVPDPPEALTSSFGWNLNKDQPLLTPIIASLKALSIRTSLFIDPVANSLDPLSRIKPDRIELYTFNYAKNYNKNKEQAIKAYQETALQIKNNPPTIGINAGHDLNHENLTFFSQSIPNLLEVSIGHALVCDCLNWGLEKTIKYYIKKIKC